MTLTNAWIPRFFPSHSLALLMAALAVISALFVPGCQNYDQLVEKDGICEQKWADYEAQLQRRYDLIPNIVSTVKASSKFEESTLTAVTQARADATSIKVTGEDFTDPAKMAAFQKAQDNLKGTLSRLMVSNEKYPELASTKGYRDLTVELEGTENRILRSREQYNDAVRVYNTELRKISGQAVNRVTGKPFKERVYFSASSEAQAAPKVSF